MKDFQKTTQQAIVNVLKECDAQTRDEIAAKTGIKRTSLQKALHELEDVGKICRTQDVSRSGSLINRYRYSLIDDSIEIQSPSPPKPQLHSKPPAPMKRCCRCQLVKEIIHCQGTQKWCKPCAQILGLSNHATQTNQRSQAK